MNGKGLGLPDAVVFPVEWKTDSNGFSQACERVLCPCVRAGAAVAVDEEQKLLQQLQEITRVMQEGRLVDAIPAHTADACGHQWDGQNNTSLSLLSLAPVSHFSGHFSKV